MCEKETEVKQDIVYEVIVPPHVEKELVPESSPEFLLNLSCGTSTVKHIHYRTVEIPEKRYYFSTMEETNEFCSKSDYPFVYMRKRYLLNDTTSI